MASDSTEKLASAPAGASALSDAPRNYGLFVVFIAIIGAFSSLVNDMYLPTIPSMMREFHTTPSMTQMGISMAMIGMGLGSVLWGSASDSYGRKPILIVSLVIFVISTALSLFSKTITFFIVCRLFQGLGAGERWCFLHRYPQMSIWAGSLPS